MSFLKIGKLVNDGVSVVKDDIKTFKPIVQSVHKTLNDFGLATSEAQHTNSGKPLDKFVKEHSYKPGMLGNAVSSIGNISKVVGKNMVYAGDVLLVADEPEVAAELKTKGKMLQKAGQQVQKVGKQIYKVEKGLQNFFSNDSHLKDHHHKHLIVTNASYTGEVPPGYTIDKSSNKNAIVLEDDETNDIYIGYRGTENVSDLLADTYIVLGNEDKSDRFQESEELYKRVKAEHPNKKIHLSGHSLGGALASHVACKHKVESLVTFNKGSNPIVDFKRDDNKCKTKGDHYKTAYDPISTGVYFNKNVYIIPQIARDPHTILNFV